MKVVISNEGIGRNGIWTGWHTHTHTRWVMLEISKTLRQHYSSTESYVNENEMK